MLHTPTKKGFVIQVISHENDCDNLLEKNIYGLSEKNKNFLYKFLKQLHDYQTDIAHEIPEKMVIKMLKGFAKETEEDLLLELQKVNEEKKQFDNVFRSWVQRELLGYPNEFNDLEDYLRQIYTIRVWYMQAPMELILEETN